MNYQDFVDFVEMPCCVLAVRKAGQGESKDIRIVCANQSYKEVMGAAFYDNMPYHELVPKDNKFEDFCFRSACMGQRMHAYVEARAFGGWIDQTLIPMASDDESTGYCQFIYEFTPKPEVDRMASVSASTALSVVRSCIKLVGAADFRESVVSVLEDVVEETGATASDILILDHDKKEMTVFSEVRKPEYWKGKKSTEELIDYSLAKSWEAMIGESNCVIVINDDDMKDLGKHNPAWVASMNEGGVKTLALIPLVREQKVIGYLYVVNYNVKEVVRVKELLELTAFFLGAEIANYQLLQRLDEMSRIDALTGLNNHNAMIQVLKEFMAACDNDPFGVVNLDLNGLKQVNDMDGHDAGDRLLVHAGELLRRNFSEKDIYRGGGDEFIVIANKIDREDFDRKVEKLRADAEESTDVSIAIGSFWSDGSVDIVTAFRKADQIMYADKREYYEVHPRNRRL